MSETIITFKAIRNGRIIYKSIPIYHNFTELPSEQLNGVTLPPTSVEQQVIEMLDQMDKTELMSKHGFDIILNYYPKKKRIKRSEVYDFAIFCQPYLNEYPQLVIPFRKVISESKDILFGKGKSNEQKLKEVLNLINVSLKAAEGAINLINSILHQKYVSIT